jgi:hypothetical protein
VAALGKLARNVTASLGSSVRIALAGFRQGFAAGHAKWTTETKYEHKVVAGCCSNTKHRVQSLLNQQSVGRLLCIARHLIFHTRFRICFR